VKGTSVRRDLLKCCESALMSTHRVMTRVAAPDRVVGAKYTPEPGGPSYSGNPLVEALPSPYSREEVAQLLYESRQVCK
jgi:hypothetical protein